MTIFDFYGAVRCLVNHPAMPGCSQIMVFHIREREAFLHSDFPYLRTAHAFSNHRFSSNKNAKRSQTGIF